MQHRFNISFRSLLGFTQRPRGHPFEKIYKSVGFDGEVNTSDDDTNDEDQHNEEHPERSLLIYWTYWVIVMEYHVYQKFEPAS